MILISLSDHEITVKSRLVVITIVTVNQVTTIIVITIPGALFAIVFHLLIPASDLREPSSWDTNL